MRSRFAWGVFVVASVLALAGCGGEPPPPQGQGEVAPVDSGAIAAASSQEQALVVAQVLGQGLDRLELPDPEVAALDERAARGPDAPSIAESSRPIDRTTPRALLGAALDALRAGDVAALARLSHPRDERPVLDEEDALEAERRFLAPAVQPYWRRVSDAVGRDALRLEAAPGAPDEAVLRLDVGGAAGELRLRLRKRGDGWYLAG